MRGNILVTDTNESNLWGVDDIDNVKELFSLTNLSYSEVYENEVVSILRKKWPLFEEIMGLL